ncbi:Beta-hexosaminidase subunit beta isoform X1 [Oopsacas minuta]|uniref:Beta-hexosaminidase n=1 Tax=Oopsacas minuta TaxID=111878 RepID=A0AAV7KAL1_9METZ|nr:Beta-hexosaminidase subunit beta isoform X1 [Oopsacas minuta]
MLWDILFILCSVILSVYCEFSKVHISPKSGSYVSITTKTNISSYVWPYPIKMTCTDNAYYILRNEMHFALMSPGEFPNSHPILSNAFNEYYHIIHDLTKQIPDSFIQKSKFEVELGFIQLNVTLDIDDASLTFDTKEDYNLSVGYPASTLMATNVYGALRGIETFSQLILEYSDNQLYVHECDVNDAPYFKHRGILYDTSRHFLPVPLLKTHLDVMAWNKFNIFHWHIVDMQAFPYVSDMFPDMSAKGAYSSRHTYSKSDVQEVITHANMHGIRVMVEFDTPGHTDSWGKGQPGLLTPCYTDDKPDGTYGPINAISDVTWPFLTGLFKEIVSEFKYQYIHLGGDEVNFDCWKSNPYIQQWMKESNYTDYAMFEQFYMNKLIELVEQLGKSYVVWQEVFDNGNKIKQDTIIHVWKDSHNWEEEMNNVTAAGYHALLSSCWYINLISHTPDYETYFRCDPEKFGGTNLQEILVLGGEATIWAELVDGTNSLSRVWPRASPIAERLWTGSSTIDISNDELYDRLHKHRCRLLNRGIPAEPLGPGYCTYPWE